MTGEYTDNAIGAVQRTAVVPLILEIICRITGLGFACVAKVTPEQWMACEVRDEIRFGLKPGDELKIDTTICKEICESGVEVVIDHVANDAQFRDHHTPAMYGFQSYISVPVWLADGSFFGTLCGIDPNPAVLRNNATTELFKTYAALIAMLMDADRSMPAETVNRLRQRCAMALRAHLINVTGVTVEEHDRDNVQDRPQTSPQLEAVMRRSIADIRELLATLKERV